MSEVAFPPEDSCYVTWQIKRVVCWSLPEGNYQLIGWQATYVVWMVSPPSSCSPVGSPESGVKTWSRLSACMCVLLSSYVLYWARFSSKMCTKLITIFPFSKLQVTWRHHRVQNWHHKSQHLHQMWSELWICVFLQLRDFWYLHVQFPPRGLREEVWCCGWALLEALWAIYSKLRPHTTSIANVPFRTVGGASWGGDIPELTGTGRHQCTNINRGNIFCTCITGWIISVFMI